MQLQYNWKHRFYQRRGAVSECFDKVVPPNVNVVIDIDMWQSITREKTPITSVKILPYRDSPALKAFLPTFEPQVNSLRYIWQEFKQGIYEQWGTSKIHVIGTSSGYDSRLIAKAVKQLTRKHGKGWLGETYFVECGGEAEGFKAVMETLDFKNYVIWEPNYTFDFFKDHYKRYNGLCAYPVNQWYDFYIKNWDENDIQYISGYGANVADAMRSNSPFLGPIKKDMTITQRLRHFFRWNYYYQLSAFREPKNSFHPFWSWRYIRAVSGYDHKMKKTSHILANKYVAECNHIRRMTIEGDVQNAGYLTLKPRVVKKLYDWYLSTKYGKVNRNFIEPSAQIEYSRWWLQFCIASYLDGKNNYSGS